jgi:zinc protease
MSRSLNTVALTALTLASVVGTAGTIACADDKGATKSTAPAAGFDWTKMDAPLPTDGRLVTGELPNGTKYIVMKHSVPPERAALWIQIGTGSLNETDKQRGIAHYLEHMAFNGSENFPAGTVVPFFQSLGLSFGRHQNAFTSFDRTAYQLELPNNKPETIQKAMLFFADVSGKLALLPTEIESERQIILEEKRSRSSAQQRVQEKMLKEIAPGSRIGERLPIGTEETILGVQEQDFKDYYGKWYVPSNMTVMVVADADPAELVSMIEKNFGAGKKVPKPVNEDVGIKPDTANRAVVVTDKELTRASISLQRISPMRAPATTVGLARRDLVEAMASAAFDRRIEKKVNAGELAMQGGGAGVSSLFNSAVMVTASATGEGTKWKAMLEELTKEVVRARQFGFTEQEMEDVRKETISQLEQAAQTEAGMPARAYLGRFGSQLAAGEPIMSAQQSLEMVKALAPGVSASEASAVFKEAFEPGSLVFVAQMPEAADNPTKEEVLAIGKAALGATVEAEKAQQRADSLMTKLPTPGTIVESSSHDASGVTSAWLSNGVRVHHRFMDYKKNEVSVSISLYGGALTETAANRGVTSAATVAWSRPATSTLSTTQIRDLMTGKKVNVGGGGGQDALRMGIGGNPTELETGFQLAHLLLTDPVIEPAAFKQWKERQLQNIENQSKNPQAFFGKLVPEVLFPESEVRVKALTKEQVEAVTLEAANARLKGLLATSPIEIAIVGDISKDEAMALAERYVGSLPARERVTPETNRALRLVPREKGAKVAERTMVTKTPMAVVLAGFFGPDETATADVRAMSLATRILSTRMIAEVREKEQLVYSIGCQQQPGTTFPGYGLVLATAPTEPGKTARLGEKVQSMYAEFAANGPTEEEMTTAKLQLANNLDETMKEPDYWMAQVDTMDYAKVNLDEVVNAPALVQKITAEEVKAAFNKYYSADNTVTISVKPEQTSEAPAAEPAKEEKKEAAPAR